MLYQLSYKGSKTNKLKKMREAGFEPAHPEIVGLKSTALDHSAIRAKSSLSFKPIFSFVFYFPHFNHSTG
jgi:hypothetical protein